MVLGVILGMTLILASWGLMDTMLQAIDKQFNDVGIEDATVVFSVPVGTDQIVELAAVDGEWAVPFVPGPYDGMATPHTLTLDVSRSWPSGEEHSADGSE